MVIPIHIGNKKSKEICSFIFCVSRCFIKLMSLLSNLVKTSMSFVYIPSIKAKVAPDTPGIIFATPITMP